MVRAFVLVSEEGPAMTKVEKSSLEKWNILAAQQSVTEIENYLNRQISELQGQTSTSQVSNPLGELWERKKKW